MTMSSRPWEEISDEELAATCSGLPVDEDAWEAFYTRHHAFVQSQVRRTLKSSTNQEVDDLTQDAFVKIFRALPSYNPARSGFRTFMAHVIANLVIDNFRRGGLARSQTSSLEDELGVLRIRSSQNPELLGAAAEQIVLKLNDKNLIELMLDLLHGKEVKTICKERHLSESQVYKARNWLRDMLREASTAFPKY